MRFFFDWNNCEGNFQEREIVRQRILVAVCLFVFGFVQGQYSPGFAGLLSDGYSGGQKNPVSSTGNPAVLAAYSSVNLALFSERLFLLPDLNHVILAAGMKLQSGYVGVQMDYRGGPDYNETAAGFAYARNLGKKLDAGLRFNYYSRKVNGYGGNAAVAVEIGTMFHLTSNLHAGLYASNPVGGKWKNTNEKIPAVYTMGFGYDASEKCFISFESVKVAGETVQVNASLKYTFIEDCFVRTAIQSGTDGLAAGLGYRFNSLQLEVIVSSHNRLGITPGICVSYIAKEKTK